MDRRIALLPLLALAGTSLSGCVAAAIPVLAGGAIFGSQVADDGSPTPVAARPAPTIAAAAPSPVPSPAAAAVPSVTVAAVPDAAGRDASVGAAAAVQAAPAAAPAPVAMPSASVAPAPAPVASAALPPAPAPATPPAPKIAVAPMPAVTPPSAATATGASMAAAAPSVATAVPPQTIDAPSSPRPDPGGFARFMRYGRGVAAVSSQASGPLSAMLADPIALDGVRKRCGPDEQPVAVIALDPAGSEFTPPAAPMENPGLTLGLAVLREAGVQIAWISNVPVNQIGAVRTALEQSGLDPRGEDIVSLRRDVEDRKQARKESLATTACIVAMAGDEKPDFDERFRYLKNPKAGAALETAIDDGWFLIEPVFPVGN